MFQTSPPLPHDLVDLVQTYLLLLAIGPKATKIILLSIIVGISCDLLSDDKLPT
jgi:hypothetical protein